MIQQDQSTIQQADTQHCTEARPRTHAGYIPELDGLRGLAVLFVLLAHSPVTALHCLGGFGVTIFFVLSGFLITRILLHEKQQGVPLRAFLVRRAARIFPAYYLLLIVCGFWRGWDGIPYAALYVYNWSPSELVLPPYLGHTWSLCVEEQFYLLWPLVVTYCSASRRVGVRLLVYCLALYPLFELFAPAAGFGNYVSTLMYRATPFQAVPLLIGCMAAYSEDCIRSYLKHNMIPILLLCGVILYLWTTQTDMITGQLHLTIKSLSRIAAATMLFLLCQSPVAARVLSLSPLRWCGMISYGLYLYHAPIYAGLLGDKNIWFTLPATFVVAIVSYFLYEKPIRGIGYRVSKSARMRIATAHT